MTVRILCGHVIDILRQIEDESVHCVCTSPPYYGLRDYGIEPQVWGGIDAERCATSHWVDDTQVGYRHDWGDDVVRKQLSGGDNEWSKDRYLRAGGAASTVPESKSAFCRRCNAWRGSLGLEPTPGLFIQHMVSVFREVRRVMRRDASLWINIGDSYASGGRSTYRSGASDNKGHLIQNDMARPQDAPGIKPKDLLGIPWMLAFALRDDGWWLRSEITWAKRAPMPESCTDRPTSATEKVFLLTKSARYFYDAEAVKEDTSEDTHSRGKGIGIKNASIVGRDLGIKHNADYAAAINGPVSSRNMRNWWEFDTIDNGQSLQARKNLHRLPAAPAQVSLFTEEERLDRELLPSVQCTEGAALADSEGRGTPEGSAGLSPVPAGESRSREVLGVSEGHRGTIQEEHEAPTPGSSGHRDHDDAGLAGYPGDASERVRLLRSDGSPADAGSCDPNQQGRSPRKGKRGSGVPAVQQPQKGQAPLTNFWKLGPEPFPEAHFATFPTEIPRRAILAGTMPGGTVLDPFLGAGTTALVADQLGRNCIGIELNPEYAEMARHRIVRDAGMFADIAAE